MMSFSSIAVEWREKEAKKSNNFIIYSLVISSVSHIVVLIFDVSNFLVSKVPEIESEPIEVEIVEPPIEIAKQSKKQLPLSQSSGGGGGGLPGLSTQANTSITQPNSNSASTANSAPSENREVRTASPSRRNESNSSDEPRKVTPNRKRSLQRLSDILRRKPEAPPKETQETPSTPAQKPVVSEENKEQN